MPFATPNSPGPGAGSPPAAPMEFPNEWFKEPNNAPGNPINAGNPYDEPPEIVQLWKRLGRLTPAQVAEAVAKDLVRAGRQYELPRQVSDGEITDLGPGRRTPYSQGLGSSLTSQGQTAASAADKVTTHQPQVSADPHPLGAASERLYQPADNQGDGHHEVTSQRALRLGNSALRGDRVSHAGSTSGGWHIKVVSTGKHTVTPRQKQRV